MRRSRSKIFDLRAGGFQDLRISKGSQPPPPFRIDTVCLRFTGEEACCFRVVSTASCIKVAWPRVYRRACFSESPPIHRFPGRKRRARNGTERIIKATQPLSTVPRLVRVSGTWLGLDTREIIPRNDETRSNAMFFGEGGHSARFPDCHEPIFLLLFRHSTVIDLSSPRRASSSWKD